MPWRNYACCGERRCNAGEPDDYNAGKTAQGTPYSEPDLKTWETRLPKTWSEDSARLAKLNALENLQANISTKHDRFAL